jgi:transposase InsO family protein
VVIALSGRGEAGLIDRSSAPRCCPHATPEERVQAIAVLRRLRLTGEQIADLLSIPETTVSGILKRIGMGRLGRLGLEPERRYRRARPGELVHVDVKKLGRIIRPGHRVTASRLDRRDQGKKGWEFVHIAIDDATRLAYVEVLPDERAVTAVAFFRRALRFFARYGIKVERIMSDNGSLLPSQAARPLLPGARNQTPLHQPLPAQTNGKAERFIRTLLEGWAYAAIYTTSEQRTAALDGWLWTYNHHRRHRSLGRKPPAAQLTEPNTNNLLGSYT